MCQTHLVKIDDDDDDGHMGARELACTCCTITWQEAP